MPFIVRYCVTAASSPLALSSRGEGEAFGDPLWERGRKLPTSGLVFKAADQIHSSFNFAGGLPIVYPEGVESLVLDGQPAGELVPMAHSTR